MFGCHACKMFWIAPKPSTCDIFGQRTILAIGFSHGISKPKTTNSYGISKPTTTYATIYSLAKTPSTTSPPSLTIIIESTTIRCWSPSRWTSYTKQ